MFVIYDSLKEKSIVCFKPDIRRGKYKQVSIAEEEPAEKLCSYVTFTSQTSADCFRKFNERHALSRSARCSYFWKCEQQIIQRELQREYDKHADSQYACAIRVAFLSSC